MSRGPRDEGGFASRWSRLKQEAREAQPEGSPEDAPDAPPSPEAVQAEADAAAAEKTDADILEELELPDPDAMAMGDDFSAFMSPRVPTRLRNRALRRLWRSNPVLANLDQLNDYDGDFTDAATAGQVVRTAYQVGRGFIDKAAALLEEEETAPAAEGDSAPPPDGEAAAGQAPPPDPETAPEAVPAAAPDSEDLDAEPDDLPPLKPRKSMRFTFDDGAA